MAAELSYRRILTLIGLVEVVFAQEKPTTVVVVELGAVYALTSDVPIPMLCAFLNVFAIIFS